MYQILLSSVFRFLLETKIEREGLRFYDVRQELFHIYGVFWENGMFRRMPEEIAKSVSDGVHWLHTNCAGGRVRFVTDSPYVAIQTEYIPRKMPHFAFSGSAGFDLYATNEEGTRYMGTFMPPLDVKDGYESVIDFTEGVERDITINLPLYSSVKKLYIGLKDGCVLKEAPEYAVKKPVVYYGSSITQDGCASKPGRSYESILSRRMDCDHISLGLIYILSAADGNASMEFGFKGDEVGVFMTKNAEAFLEEYYGYANGRKIRRM